jgi:ABC-2 type transport system permease protein
MAGLMLSAETRGQLAAIALVRWQLTVNSLRTIRGRLELVSKVFMGLGIAVAGLGGGLGIAAASWFFVSHAKVESLAIFLWLMFIFWQLFPVVATAFTETADSSNLLRFPLSYRSYFLIQMAYGSLDPPTVLCTIWLVCMTIGTGIAAPGLLLWTAIVLFAFALVNLLLARMIFAWVERWLAKRRTREIMGIVFFILIISIQFISPVMSRYGSRAHPDAARTFGQMLPFERLMPPGLAASAMARAGQAESGMALGSFALLCGYGIAILWLLNLRVRKQYVGENLSEGRARVAAGTKVKLQIREGWELPRASGPAAAIFEKEFRYLFRSGPMLFMLVMPVLILMIFRFAMVGAGKGENFLGRAPDFAFPIGAAYTLMMVVGLLYNSFGADAAGVQFFFASPVRFREILMAKNLAQGTVIALEIVAVWIVAGLLFGAPSFAITCATLAGLLYGAPVNLAVGNLLSLYSPKKIDLGKFGRQRATGLTTVASLGSQIVVVGLAVLTFFGARLLGSIWIATAVYLVFAVIAWVGYALVLQRVDGIALDRRETMIAELSRA